MEIRVEENCTKKENITNIANLMSPYFDKLVDQYKIKNLCYLVVADMDINNYADTVKKYAKILNCNSSVTNDGTFYGAGKTLEGISDSGKNKQIIIIKSGLLSGMYFDVLRLDGVLLKDTPEMDKLRNIGLVTILHEFGHVIDNQNIYSLKGYIMDQEKFDLSKEFEDYIETIIYSILGEYFAESFPFKIYGYLDNIIEEKEKVLLEILKSSIRSQERKVNIIAERIYRILYLFVQYLAGLHYGKKEHWDYRKYENDHEIYCYIKFLTEIEQELFVLCDSYPNWNCDCCFDRIKCIVKDMIELELER